MRVSPCYISIGNHHLAGLVALDPIWSEEVVLVIGELRAFDQPFGEPLLSDGFNLFLSTIGNEELPDITDFPQVFVHSLCKAPYPFGCALLVQR